MTAISPENAAQAAAHPLRATVLAKLGVRVYSPNELATELGASLGRVSYRVDLDPHPDGRFACGDL